MFSVFVVILCQSFSLTSGFPLGTLWRWPLLDIKPLSQFPGQSKGSPIVQATYWRYWGPIDNHFFCKSHARRILLQSVFLCSSQQCRLPRWLKYTIMHSCVAEICMYVTQMLNKIPECIASQIYHEEYI